jgi:hypothetical protein
MPTGYVAVRGFQNNANKHTNNTQNSVRNSALNSPRTLWINQETVVEKHTRILNSSNPQDRLQIYEDENNKELVNSIMKNISTKNQSDYPPNGPKSLEEKVKQENKLKLILNTFIELPDIQNTDIQNYPILNENSLFIESLRNSINSKIIKFKRNLPSSSKNKDCLFCKLISKIVIKAIIEKDNDPSTPNYPNYLASISQQSITSKISGFFSWKKTAGRKDKKKNGTRKKRKNNNIRKRKIK